jgi:hypothetical protein
VIKLLNEIFPALMDNLFGGWCAPCSAIVISTTVVPGLATVTAIAAIVLHRRNRNK